MQRATTRMPVPGGARVVPFDDPQGAMCALVGG
jgi:hypothetical protein